MAMCKCRDTGSKRCKKEWSTPDPFRTNTPRPGKQERKTYKAAVAAGKEG